MRTLVDGNRVEHEHRAQPIDSASKNFEKNHNISSLLSLRAATDIVASSYCCK